MNSYNTDDKITEKLMFKNPGPDNRTIAWNITITGGILDGGYYTITGINYDVDGLRIGDIIQGDLDDSDFLQRCLQKLHDIINNTEYSDTGVTVYGSVAGSCVITAELVLAEITELTITFDFDNYNDGASIFNGIITKYLEATIDYNGSFDLSSLNESTFSGIFIGDLTVTEANPSWSDEEFIQDSITRYEYDSVSGLLEKEVKYKDPGADGLWSDAQDTDIDDNIEYYLIYTYNSDNNLDTVTRYNDPGDDGLWFTGNDDTVDYYFMYTHEDEKLIKKTKYREYGTCITVFNDYGADEEWFTGDDDVVEYSTFEFECDE